MLPFTAVNFKKNENNENRLHSIKAGILVINFPTKTLNNNNNYSNKMFFSNNLSATFFILCLLFICLEQHCLATYESSLSIHNKFMDFTKTVSSASSAAPPPPTASYECGSLDLRNDCNDFYRLNNCTVITGFLIIAQLPSKNNKCDFTQYSFKNLREITDFLILYEIRNASSIRYMFPNLSVIRGQRLLGNYALMVASNTILEKIEFRSLIAIQRGHVLVDANPKLCFIEKINWTRLTLRPGQNYIFPDRKAQCPFEAHCNGCKRDSCWSNDVCQKIENDNVYLPTQDTNECHALCLGGCYNTSNSGCMVCKTYTDHGVCVKECPSNKYTSQHFMRCYTMEECTKNKKQFIYKNTCVDSCPSGYKVNNITRNCDSCSDTNNCKKIFYYNGDYTIHNIMEIDRLRGFEVINSNVIIYINEFIDQKVLIENFKDLKEINGSLTVNRSPFLKSMNFLNNLQKIWGSENSHYSLIIYDNKNLSELWNVKEGFELLHGGMFIHGNNKLCNRRIRLLREKIKHDMSLDSVQTSDQEVLCAPAKLNLYIEEFSHNSLRFIWPKEQTLEEVEILYRQVADKELINDKSEIDTDVCRRIDWRRELRFAHELEYNSTHYFYNIKNLQSHIRYAGLVKTFNGEDDNQEARSEIKYATTNFDIPTSPIIKLKSKTYDSLNIEFSPKDHAQVVDYYNLEVYIIADNKELLDSRDYCDEPILIYKEHGLEDYEDCCSRREEERKDEMFLSQLKKDFSCSLDRPQYCKENNQEFNDTRETKAILIKRFEAWQTNYTIRSLERFHLYVLQLQACNHAGCSSFALLSTRTNYSTGADQIYDFSACKMPNTNDYKVKFSQPQIPNGYITSYALHFRYHEVIRSPNTPEHNDVICITRLEHERNNFLFNLHSNYSFNQAAVRVNSLGHNSLTNWFNITACPTTKLAGRGSQGWNIFFVFFLIGAFGTLLWVGYKRRYWRKIPQLRRYLQWHWRYLRPESLSEDRQILVDGFETVHFHNSPEEDKKYLVHQ